MTTFEPAPEAEALAERMVAETDVQRTILTETLDSAEDGQITESGRTACGSLENIQQPHERFARAVELQACPLTGTGAWHTHASRDELSDPEHSIPDWANVAYGHWDASMVVGTHTSDVIVRATDREAMRERFQEVVGVQADTVRDVVDALDAGETENPTAIRAELRKEFGNLVDRVTTQYPDLQQRSGTLTIPAHRPQGAREKRILDLEDDDDVQVDQEDVVAVATETFDAGGLRESARSASVSYQELTGDVSIKNEVISVTIGTVVGNLINRAIFGS